jgi:hypothetical protein
MERVADDVAIVSLLACFLAFSLQYVVLQESEQAVWYPYLGSWLLSLAFEPAITALSMSTARFDGPPHFEFTEYVIVSLRYLVLLCMVGTYCARWYASRTPPPSSDEERQSLLHPASADGSSSGDSEASYGSTLQGDQTQTVSPEYPWEERERKARERMEKKLLEEGNWLTYVKRFRVSSIEMGPLPATTARLTRIRR